MSMALLTTRLPPWQRPGRALLITVAGFALATIGFGLSKSMALSLACLFLTGVFDSVSVVIRLTLEQVLTPDPLRGRVSSIHYVFIGFSNELGGFESGATAALLGPVVSVAGGGVAALLVVAVVAAVWPQLARLGPLAHAAAAGRLTASAAPDHGREAAMRRTASSSSDRVERGEAEADVRAAACRGTRTRARS